LELRAFFAETAATLMARHGIDELKSGDVSLLICLLGKIGFSPNERGRMNLPTNSTDLLEFLHNSGLHYWPSAGIVAFESFRDHTVSDFIALHSAEIWTFLTGLLGGGAAGSLITYRVTQTNRASGGGTVSDQSGAKAGGDIVGRDKRNSA
jgi:hypothetical protein